MSFVRALPFSQDQSASENGATVSGCWVVATAAAACGACWVLGSTAALDEEPGWAGTAPAGGAGAADGIAGSDVTIGAGEGADGNGFAILASVAPAGSAGFGCFASSSATLFSSCSTRSSNHCSRSVNPAAVLGGASVLGTGFVDESVSFLSSSARADFGTPRASRQRSMVARIHFATDKMRIVHPPGTQATNFMWNGSRRLPLKMQGPRCQERVLPGA
jgi:hypothetical protein